MLAQHWDNVHLTAKIALLFVRIWTIFTTSFTQHY